MNSQTYKNADILIHSEKNFASKKFCVIIEVTGLMQSRESDVIVKVFFQHLFVVIAIQPNLSITSTTTPSGTRAETSARWARISSRRTKHEGLKLHLQNLVMREIE